MQVFSNSGGCVHIHCIEGPNCNSHQEKAPDRISRVVTELPKGHHVVNLLSYTSAFPENACYRDQNDAKGG